MFQSHSFIYANLTLGSKSTTIRKNSRGWNLNTVSLCLICKNEKANIRGLLEDVCLVLEEVHITDTGSTDGTLEILEELKTTYPNLYVHHFVWVDDFSAARNYSFCFGTSCEWVMWLDCDDRVDSAALLKFKNEVLDHKEVGSWHLPYIYGTSVTLNRERFVRRSFKPRWRCAIHEYLDVGDAPVRQYQDLQVRHNHVGKVRDEGRNLRILEKEFEKDSNIPRIAYYYGKELADSGANDKATKVLQHYLDLKCWHYSEDDIGARFRLACIYLKEKDYTKALHAIEPVYHLEAKRNRAEYYFIFGEVEMALRNLEVAILWYVRCLCRPPETGVINKDYWSYLPILNIALCYRDLGLWDKVYETICRMQDPRFATLVKELKSYKIHPKEEYPTEGVILEFGTDMFPHSYKVGKEPFLVNVGKYCKYKASNWQLHRWFPLLDESVDGFVVDQSAMPVTEFLRVLKPGGFLYTRHEIKNMGFELAESGELNKYVKPVPEAKVAASFTTCRRPESFHRAYHSFKLRCLDEQSMSIYVVDDLSPDEDLKKMQRTAPDAIFLKKETKGHASSINTLIKEVIAKGFDYLVFMEDDFFYIRDLYVSRAIDFMRKDPQIGQVLFNKNYAESDTAIENDTVVLSGKEVKDGDGNTQYLVHDWKRMHSPTWEQFVYNTSGKSSHAHWPNFSLNNGVWNLKAIKQVGLMDDEENFEFKYAVRYSELGFSTAFLPEIHCIHLGKPRRGILKSSPEHLEGMIKRHGLHMQKAVPSAYDLNGTPR